MGSVEIMENTNNFKTPKTGKEMLGVISITIMQATTYVCVNNDQIVNAVKNANIIINVGNVAPIEYIMQFHRILYWKIYKFNQL